MTLWRAEDDDGNDKSHYGPCCFRKVLGFSVTASLAMSLVDTSSSLGSFVFELKRRYGAVNWWSKTDHCIIELRKAELSVLHVNVSLKIQFACSNRQLYRRASIHMCAHTHTDRHTCTVHISQDSLDWQKLQSKSLYIYILINNKSLYIYKSY